MCIVLLLSTSEMSLLLSELPFINVNSVNIGKESVRTADLEGHFSKDRTQVFMGLLMFCGKKEKTSGCF